MTDITLPRSVVEQALKALEASGVGYEIDVLAFWEKQHAAVAALRAALEQPQDHHEQTIDMVPAGWKLVPVEPTLEMIKEMCAYDGTEYSNPFDSDDFKDDYRNMLASAPKPPVMRQSVTNCHQSQPQAEQEPVAYFYTRSGRVVSTEATDALMQQMIGESGRVALYAHPQPPRQRLTNEAEHQCPYPKANPSTRNAWLDGWEAAERAHGIGGEA